VVCPSIPAAQPSRDEGDFARTLTVAAESLVEAAAIEAGEHVLDVASGGGNAALAAARRNAKATAIEEPAGLLALGRSRAAAEGLAVDFLAGDVEDLAGAGDVFDAVVSVFGMSTLADPGKAARALGRACRSHGRIGLARWASDGFMGDVFRCIERYAPDAQTSAPLVFGDEADIRAAFAPFVSRTLATRRYFSFCYRSAEHWFEVLRAHFPPLRNVIEAIDPDRRSVLQGELVDLARGSNAGGTRALVVPAEYLEVVMERR
jgi:ubiquinone/menaquinone biosynthesis C-methylase UbiE